MTLLHRVVIPFAAATALGVSSLCLAADNDKVLATVNGKPITQQDYDNYLSSNKGSSIANAGQDKIMNELISRELVYQDAIKKGVDKQQAVKDQIEALSANVILGAALQDAVKSNPVSDKELKELYDQQISNFKLQEYKARHILLKSKDEADKVITELDMGGDFAELAKKKSTGPTGKKGGDLGWFAPQQMVPEFSQQVVKMDKGAYTKEPVKTKFGWHVIKLEDTRQAEPPSFDSVKPKLKQMVEQQRLGNYVKGLRENAKVEVK